MIKNILQVILIMTAIVLSWGLSTGSAQYTSTGESEIMFLSIIGIILWIPLMVFILKYLMEDDK